MTKLQELKATYDAACDSYRDAVWYAIADEAADAADAAYDAYQAELKKTQKEQTND